MEDDGTQVNNGGLPNNQATVDSGVESPSTPYADSQIAMDPDSMRVNLPRLAIPAPGIHPVSAPKPEEEEWEDSGIQPLEMFAPVVAGPPRSGNTVQMEHTVDKKAEESNKSPTRRKRPAGMPRIPKPPATPPNPAPSNLTFAPHSASSEDASGLGTWTADLMGKNPEL